MFQDCHPGPTGRSGRRLFPLGQNMPQDPVDDGFCGCGQCGLLNDLTKIIHGDSEDSPGLQVVQTTVAIPGGTKVVLEMQVVAGCRKCGTLNPTLRNKMKPYSVRTPNRLRLR